MPFNCYFLIKNLRWEIEQPGLVLSFGLANVWLATELLREIIIANTTSKHTNCWCSKQNFKTLFYLFQWKNLHLLLGASSTPFFVISETVLTANGIVILFFKVDFWLSRTWNCHFEVFFFFLFVSVFIGVWRKSK